MHYTTAIDTAINLARVCPRFRRNLRRSSDQFIQFASGAFPDLSDWSNLTSINVAAFVRHCENRGLAATTIYQYCQPIVLTERTMDLHFPADKSANLNVYKLLPPRRRRTKVYLEADQLLACILAAKTRAARLGFWLGGICGMRLSEIARIRRVDLQDDVLTIPKSKTLAGERVIPLPKAVAAVLGRDLAKAKADRPLYRDIEYLSHAMRAVLDAQAVATHDETFDLICPKDAARKTSINLFPLAGIHPDYRRAYHGHACAGVDEIYYLDKRCEPDCCPRERARKIAELREHVVRPLEDFLRTAHFPLDEQPQTPTDNLPESWLHHGTTDS